MKRIILSVTFFLLLPITSNGQNLFGPLQLISNNPTETSFVSAGRIDGDKYWDVVSYSYNTLQLIWYKNQGDGTFGEPNVVDAEIEDIYDLKMADLDGDGDEDILAISESEDLVLWYVNDGNGQFGAAITISTEADSPRAVEAADLDGDGDLDVLSASHWDAKIAWYANDGDGNFEAQQVIHTDLFSTSDVYAADLDGDGDLDVLGTSYNDGRIFWSENLGSGNFEAAVLISIDFNSPQSVLATDFDGDEDADVLMFSYWDKTLVLFENDGNANFTNYTIIADDVSRARGMAAVDLDNDGDLDILFAASGNNQIAWFENGGNGLFSDRKIVYEQVWSPMTVFAADLDRDGDQDVISVDSDTKSVAWYENLLQPNQLTALVFHDQNENGLFDTSEKPLNNFELLLNPGNYETFTNLESYTHFFTDYGDYQLTYEENTLWEITTPNTVYDIQYNANASLPIYQFGFKPTRILPRVTPHLSSSPTRCNRETTYWLNYSNTGTTITKGTITLEVDELMAFISSNPEPDAIEGRNLIWNFVDLHPSYENKIKLHFKMPNADFIGDMIETQATVQLFNENEELVATKTQTYDSELLCSFDPNDKLTRSNLLGQSEFAYIADTILYTVRFQNTGNDTAFNIRIEDTLDKKLDWTTFHPITASHDYRTELNRETGLATFYFNDILLPDSTTNEAESHGFVMFGIASLEGIEDKTKIENTASIFFDFNPPIITNTAVLTLLQQVETDIEVLENGASIRVFPNPFSDFTTIEVEGLPQGNYRLEVMDILGRKVRELKSIENGKWKIERGKLESGVYFWRILEEGNQAVLGRGKVLVE